MVVGIGAGGLVAQHLAFGDFCDEHHVAAQVLFIQDLAGEHGVGGPYDVVDAVGGPLAGSKISELVHVTGSLHTEMADRLKGNVLSEGTDVELPGFLDDLTGLVAHLDRDGEMGGIVCHLDAGVGDEAVVLVILCGDDKQTVA